MALYDKTWGSPYSSKNETSSIMGSLLNVPDDSQFTLENIPFGVFSTREDASPRCATAIGDYAVDLRALSQTGSFQDESVNAALSQVRCVLVREYGSTRWERVTNCSNLITSQR